MAKQGRSEVGDPPPFASFRGSSDTALAVGITRRQVAALREAYRRNASAARTMANELRIDSVEAVYDAFVALWRQPQRYDPEAGSLRNFLLAEVGAELTPDAEVESLVTSIRGLIPHNMRELFDGLDPVDATTTALVVFGECTYREAAEILGENERVVRNAIRSGLAQLHQTPWLSNHAPRRRRTAPLRIERPRAVPKCR